MLALAAVLQLMAASPAQPPVTVYHGRSNATTVQAPRLAATVAIDGRLTEPVWSQAAVLTGFSQYQPVDGVPAADSTDVLIWYSPYALHLGIRAHEPHGTVNANLADRDRIFGDDYIQILLDTFSDRRRALLFAVNPLGVQADGYQTEEQRASAMFGADESSAAITLSPDFLFDSKGRVTEYGYEVEIRIPFKSIRYPAKQPQTWGINIVRQVQHAGQTQTWTPVRRGATSFLAQSGSLADLSGLRRGLVMDVNPVVTSQATGVRDPASAAFERDYENPEIGLNARWGITTDLTLNGTVNPDFSQIESDVAQIQFDPRSPLSFPEKRPFFLEGNEQFAAPGGLIYTRRIVDPVAAVKLGGKVGGTDIGFLSAVDDEAWSRDLQSHPVYNLLRLRRGVGAQSTLGFTYTDRIAGDDYNRVASVDTRLVLNDRYTVSAQLAGSRTRVAESTLTAPLWSLALARSGREFGWTFNASGRDPDFRASSGFIGRTGIANLSLTPRRTFFGAEGSRLQSWSTSLTLNGMWLYDRLLNGELRGDELKLHWNNTLQLRGGWRLGGSLLVENFLLPEELYRDYWIDLGSDTVPFVGRPSINNYDAVISWGTPQWQRFSGDGFILFGRDENFNEWAPGYLVWAELGGEWRPTDRLRVQGHYNETRVMRPDDWSVAEVTQIPRVKLEYQLSRPFFVRAVSQYVAIREDALQDDGRTDRPILRRRSDGTFFATPVQRHNELQFDWLFSYQPNPGTVFFAGYASTLTDLRGRRTFETGELTRTQDGFFVKVSYLFRL